MLNKYFVFSDGNSETINGGYKLKATRKLSQETICENSEKEVMSTVHVGTQSHYKPG